MRQSRHQTYLNRNNRSVEQRLKYRYSVTAAAALMRYIHFDLQFQDYLDLWNKQKGKCAYSGKQMYTTVGKGFKGREHAVSIDRLDPTKAYTKDNVVLCRFSENRRKQRQNFFTAQFLERYPEKVAAVLKIHPNLNLIAA